jgi:hypothetical protein
LKARYLQELVDWAVLTGDATLLNRLCGHLPPGMARAAHRRQCGGAEQRPNHTGLTVEVLNSHRFEKHHRFGLNTKLGLLLRGDQLYSLDSFAPLHHGLGSATFHNRTLIGRCETRLTEFDPFRCRVGARWLKLPWVTGELIVDDRCIYVQHGTLVSYSLRKRSQAWSVPDACSPTRLDGELLFCSPYKQQTMVLRAADGEVVLKIPGDGLRARASRHHLLVFGEQGWTLYNRMDWSEVARGEGPVKFGAWLDEARFLINDQMWDVSGLPLSGLAMSSLKSVYRLREPEQWLSWLTRQGLLTPERAAGLGVWEEPFLKLEQSFGDEPHRYDDGKTPLELTLTEFGDDAELVVVAGNYLLHLRVSPTTGSDPVYEADVPLKRMTLELLNKIRPAHTTAGWRQALESEPIRQWLLQNEVEAGIDFQAQILKRFFAGEPLHEGTQVHLYELFTPQTEPGLWQCLLAQVESTELQERIFRDLLYHPNPKSLLKGLVSDHFCDEIRPFAQLLLGEPVEKGSLRALCSWEEWERVESLLEACPGEDARVDPDACLQNALRASRSREDCQDLLAVAEPALDWHCLREIRLEQSSYGRPVPVRLTRDSSDFIANDGSSFTVWWKGDWWDRPNPKVAVFDPSGEQLALWAQGQLQLWKPQESDPVWSVDCSGEEERMKLFFSSDGRYLAWQYSSDAKVYDAVNGEEVFHKSLSRHGSQFKLGKEHLLFEGLCYSLVDGRFLREDRRYQEIGPSDKVLYLDHDTRRYSVDDVLLDEDCAVLGLGLKGVWLQSQTGLTFQPYDGTARQYPLQGWDSQQYQMFAEFSEAGLLVKDWGVWSLYDGACLLRPRRMSQKEAGGRDYRDTRFCAFDAVRSRLLLKHPLDPHLQIFRAVDPTPLARLTSGQLEERLNSAYLEEERALWNLALKLKT